MPSNQPRSRCKIVSWMFVGSFAGTVSIIAIVCIWQQTPLSNKLGAFLNKVFYTDSFNIGSASANVSSKQTHTHTHTDTHIVAHPSAVSAPVAQVNENFNQMPDTMAFAKCKEFALGTESTGWRIALKAIRPAVEAMGMPLHNGPAEIYGFGVLRGTSLKLIRKIYPSARIIGFDSFEGLPEEKKGVANIKTWAKGKWNGGDVRQKLSKDLGGPNKVQFVKGFYNESLTPELPRRLELKPAWYIDVDCDLYISTVQALDWMFFHGLVRVGTLIGYDDFWALRLWGKSPHPLNDGEGRAHAEIAAKYGVKFQCISGFCACRKSYNFEAWGPIFLVVALGSEDHDHGLHITEEEMENWLKGRRSILSNKKAARLTTCWQKS